MSYATSLQMAYPPPYGPSTLLSDDLVHRTSLVPYYVPSSVPYRTGSHLLSDDFLYNPPSSSYRSTTYPYYSPITDWQRDLPAPTSYNSINNIREYSASLGTASNATPASSIAHSINENKFPNHQQNYNRFSSDIDRQPPLSTIWSSRQPILSTFNEQSTATYRSLPELSATKLQEEIRKNATPIQPPPPVSTKQEQPSVVDVHAWLTESKRASPIDEKAAEQAWTNKIDQLHTTKAQREKEKEKAKASRALPNLPKKVVQKPATNEKRTDILTYQRRKASFFDSLFDGNFYRKPSTNQQNSNLSSSPPSKSTSNLSNKPKTTFSTKQTSVQKVPQYESPPTNRAPPATSISPKKTVQNQNPNDSLTPRENVPKDTDERFREALQKFRSDRAEQQQRELPESTAKRLSYGDYVRRSTRDGSLRNVIKPSPWTDFMDTKKGNVYSLEQEEKKDLYNQSKSYGERVRNRNFALSNSGEITHRSNLFSIEYKERQSDDDSARSSSNSTVKSTTKTFTKQSMNNETTSNQSSNSNQATEDEDDEDVSDFESNRKTKKRIYDASVPTTEESDTDKTHERVRSKKR